MNLDWNFILQSMRGESFGTFAREFTGISTDSRTIRPGQLYFALSGDRFDGHQFAASAIQNGAAAVVVQHHQCLDIIPRIEVSDPLQALQDLASCVRQLVHIPVIAITGSHGKTTTKDILAAILSQSRSTLSTYQNLNGIIGVPVTLLKLEQEHTALVIEVGISLPGEMERLASIVEPTDAIFTCVAPAHSQFLPTLRDIVDEKKRLMNHLRPGGHAILNADDPVIMAECHFPNTITYGLKSGDFIARIIQSDTSGIVFEVRHRADFIRTFHLPCQGQFNVYNALGAITAAIIMGVHSDDIQPGLDSFTMSPHRSRIIQLTKLTLIDDTYNAAPNSMRCALQLLADYPGRGRRVAVLGDMLELGESSASAHRRLGECFSSFGIDLLVAFGTEMRWMVEEVKKTGIPCFHYSDNHEVADFLTNHLKIDDIVLVKASRTMHGELIVEKLQRDYSVPD